MLTLEQTATHRQHIAARRGGMEAAAAVVSFIAMSWQRRPADAETLEAYTAEHPNAIGLEEAQLVAQTGVHRAVAPLAIG